MAKKAVDKVPESLPSGLMSKADAVRAAIKEGIDSPSDGIAFIKEKFGIDMNAQMFSSYKSQDRKKSGMSGAVKVAGRSSGNGGSSIELIRQVKTLIDKYGANELTGLVKVLSD